MSTTVDQRVVEMRFDNRQFEQNVSTTMSTLSKLKQSLNLTGATKGLENVGAAAKGINLSGLSTAADTVAVKFSYMQATIQHQLNRIVDSSIAAGKRIVSALTIDPVKTGFSEYETQINAVQTILANTKSKGTTIDDVNGALDELNTYADKTIYNFTEMTRNIGTFTAAGVDLDKSVTSIKGIANLAAVSGSTSQQASTAMYQLSQALAAGKVQLMDWNSVVNAGMGGQVFQDALKRTATHMGKDVDGMIKKYGSFRESLTQGEWLTADVLTETLTQLSGAYSEADLIAQGYTESQAKEITELADTAVNAATKVKTFTQLWDTLKEAAQSGWTQSWEIIVGDFEEAKEMLTKVSDTIGEMINSSSESRNNLLQGWKDAGGRDDLLAGFKNAFYGLKGIIVPIRDAFRDIFPPMTVDNLVKFTEGFKNLTFAFAKFTAGHENEIRSAFKGIFAVIDIGWTVVKKLAGGIVDLVGHFTGLGGGILSATGSIGDWLSNLRDTVKETDIFGAAIDKVVSFLGNAIDAVKNFGKYLKETFQVGDFLQGLWNVIRTIGSKVGEIFSPIFESIANVFSGTNLGDLFNSGLLAGIFAGVFKFGDKLTSPFEGLTDVLEGIAGEGGLLENVKGVLDDVRGCFEAYQNNLQAGTLQKIAIAIGILAASILVLSSIDGDALDHSLGAMGIMFVELLGSLAIFSKMSTNMKGVTKACAIMISMSAAIAILAGAMKILSTIDGDSIIRGLFAIGMLMAELGAFLALAKFNGKMIGTATGLVILSSAMLVMSKAVENFGAMDEGSLVKGIAAIGGLLAELAIFTNFTGNASNVLSTGAAMILLGASMKIFASALSDFGNIPWDKTMNGLAAMGFALLEVSMALKVMPSNTLSLGAGVLVMAAAMKVLASALSDFGGMSWDEIIRGLTAMGFALAEFAVGLIFMTGTMSGSAALLIATGAIALLVPVLKALGGMSWGEIIKGLVTIAGAFAVLGGAAFILMPLVPTMLALSGAMALLGVAALGIGAGLALVGIGISSIATSLAAGATAIVAGIAVIIGGVVDLIPTVILGLGDAILAICTVIKECAPAIVDTLMVLLAEVCASIATYAPQIADSLFELLIGALNVLAERMPELLSAAMNVIGSFFQGIVDALRGIDTTNLIQGIVGVGFMAALMFALSTVAGLVPGAMVGVLGMGVVIAELALVLAAIGALAQIPGLEWLIGEGGDFLQTIGTAIGQFIGGIAGGIAEGATSTLPQVGTNLSTFMTNLQPFIDGAASLDASMLTGVQALADAVLVLTGAGLVDAIASFIGGGSSLSSFAEDLVPFGTAMKNYAAEVSGIDSTAITNSVTAAKGLVDVAKSIPGDGLLGLDGIDDFGRNVVTFGKKMKEYATEVAGIDAAAVTASVSAAKGLVKVANQIPDDGTFGTDGIDDFGKNVVTFGKKLKEYADKVSGIDTAAILSSVVAVRNIKMAINSLADLDTSGVSSFKTALNSLAKTNVDGFVNAFKQAATSLTTAGSNLINAVSNGMRSKQGALGSTATSMIVTINKAISSKYSAFREAGVNIAAKLISGISSKNTNVKTAGSATAGSAVSGVREKYSSMYSAGKYIAQGLINGMYVLKSSVYYKGVELGKAAADGVNEGAGNASPSKKTYQSGIYVGEGFVNAMVHMGRSVYSAGKSLGKDAVKGVSNSIKRISDYIESGIDTTPTIRPILDLSDVRAGANSIGGLFNSNSQVGLLANVGAVSAMMSRRGQNGAESEVVSAINKLRKDIGNMPRESYSIGNVTYDDGSEIKAFAQAVVGQARRGRRS